MGMQKNALKPRNAATLNTSRRSVSSLVASLLVPAFVSTSKVLAESGFSANVFGSITNDSGFVPFSGDGFSLLLPSKWNPSKEQDFPILVLKEQTEKARIDDYGTPEAFLNSVSFLLGQQTFAGQTISEGGFSPNRVSSASVLDQDSSTDSKGRKKYNYSLLS